MYIATPAKAAPESRIRRRCASLGARERLINGSGLITAATPTPEKSTSTTTPRAILQALWCWRNAIQFKAQFTGVHCALPEPTGLDSLGLAAPRELSTALVAGSG